MKLVILGASALLAGVVTLAVREIEDIVIKNEHDLDSEIAELQGRMISNSFKVDY